MGIQISFNYKDVEHLVADDNTESYACGFCMYCQEGDEHMCYDVYTAESVLLLQGKLSIWVHKNGGVCWIDANHWGSNRAKIIPLLESNNIQYWEG